ncbi:hypothetical protein HD806DRAFT_389224 [Xylariaceae sp. AK1471]|nr:hypothetical protein HD806DRAFT_389224 [Xylariaceae sp. AK1471]
MLHSISDNRMSGSSMRNLAMIKAICGFASYTNVVIATTMWPEAPDHTEITALQAREAELLSEDKFFGSLIARGALVFRHNEEADNDFYREATSAKHIVNHLVQQSEIYAPGVLQLQREIVDQGKTLGETAAGIAAAGELYQEQKAHKHQLRKLRVEINGQLDKSNAAYVTQLRELEADAEKKLKKAEDDGQALKQRMKDLHMNEQNSLREKMEDMDILFFREISAREEELREMEESLGELRKDLARRSQKPRAEHEESVNEARKQVAQVRKVYQNFSGQFDDILKSYDLKNNVINGGVNGLVAGVTSGVIAAVASGLMCTVM